MNEQTNNTNAAFMEVTSRRIEVQDKKMIAIEEKIKNIPDNADLIIKVDALRKELSSSFSIDKLDEFGKRLDDSIHFLKLPLQNKVVHQHHVPKIIWIAAGLFIVLALVCAGWFYTSNNLESYMANDTKYRQLRLDTGNIKLQLYLDKTDSLYNASPDMRKAVFQTEQQYRQNFERLQKAERLKAEAKGLENEVKRR